MLCKKISDGEYDILCKNIITAADTLICCDGILGKPADKTERVLEIIGVGYRAQMQGKNLVLSVGYSHPIEVVPPSGIEFAVDGPTKIIVRGIDKQLVGQTAADIRGHRPPEPYKGKGIRYAGEYVIRKAGKAGGK